MMKVLLGNLVNIKTGKLDANQADVNGKYPFFTCSKEISKINSYSYDCECVLIAGNGDLNVKYYNGKFEAYQRTYILTSIDNNTLSNKYLYWFMNRYIVQLRNQSIGGVIKYIKLGDLTNISLNLPPLDIQKRIVRIFESIERLIDKKLFILQFLNDLSKSRFVEMFGNPIINDKKYPVFKLKDISQKIGSGVTPRGGDSNYIDKGVAFIRSMNVYNNTFRKDNLVYIDKSLAKQLSQVELFSNDLLLNITGASVARCCIVPDDILPARVNQHVCIIRQCRISNVFLEYCLTNESYQEYLLLLSNKNGATREALTKAQVENLEVIFPPLTEITRFVRLVHQINKLKSDVQKSIDETQLLMDSLMQEYFG